MENSRILRFPSSLLRTRLYARIIFYRNAQGVLSLRRLGPWQQRESIRWKMRDSVSPRENDLSRIISTSLEKEKTCCYVLNCFVSKRIFLLKYIIEKYNLRSSKKCVNCSFRCKFLSSLGTLPSIVRFATIASLSFSFAQKTWNSIRSCQSFLFRSTTRIARFYPRRLIAAMLLSRFRAVNAIRSYDIPSHPNDGWIPFPSDSDAFLKTKLHACSRADVYELRDGRRKNGRRVEEISEGERLLARKTARSASRRMANGSWRTRKRGGQSMPTEPFAHKSYSSSV